MGRAPGSDGAGSYTVQRSAKAPHGAVYTSDSVLSSPTKQTSRQHNGRWYKHEAFLDMTESLCREAAGNLFIAEFSSVFPHLSRLLHCVEVGQ